MPLVVSTKTTSATRTMTGSIPKYCPRPPATPATTLDSRLRVRRLWPVVNESGSEASAGGGSITELGRGEGMEPH